ncbi:MAG: enoyl-CoA hydratase/isomerase family protein, partial [Bdellovibrionota bacterium]
MSTDADAIVLSEVLPTLDGKAAIGRITLNSPKTLNALNLEIILLVQEILHRFERDPRIAAVFIDGSGDKAFCAGGDVKSIRQRILDMRERGQSPVPLARVFFENEYKMDYAIHRYPKPVIVWGDGIIMGGGIGIAAGASHRIVTETTTLAMPEITIGLYPDVGASYFLPRMPGRVGLFLGMTAGRMKAADALYVNLADHFVPRANKQKLLQSLQAASFG